MERMLTRVVDPYDTRVGLTCNIIDTTEFSVLGKINGTTRLQDIREKMSHVENFDAVVGGMVKKGLLIESIVVDFN